MKLSLLNDQELCKALEILDDVDNIEYANRHAKITELQRLEIFGDAFKNWMRDTDIKNIYMRIGFGKLQIYGEMSDRFIKKFA